jgi:hypothetical protein
MGDHHSREWRRPAIMARRLLVRCGQQIFRPLSLLAGYRTASLRTKSLFSGKRNLRAETRPPKRLEKSKRPLQRQIQCRRTPPIRRWFSRTEKSLRTTECVVADAVAIEPVSALTFPANRETNRDNAKFAQISRSEAANYLMIFELYCQNSLLVRTGNDFG